MSNRGRGTSAGSDDEPDLEIIDLEPAETPTARAETPTATGVRGRRAPVAIAVVVIAALVTSAILSRANDSRRASTSTTHAGETHGGSLFPFRVGAQILTGGASGLQVIDTDTGRVTPARITGLPEGPVTIVAHSGGTVAVRANGRLYWFSMRRRTAHYSPATTAFPAARRGSLWLASPRSATEVPGAHDAVRTVGNPIGATRAGLLVTSEAGVLLQPTEPLGDPRLLLRTPAVVIGVHPDRVAWVSKECGVLRCPVHVTEIESGESSSWLQLVGHPGPLAVELASAVFSADGNYLAVVVPDDSVERAQTLVVADLRSRATTVADVRGRFDEPARPGSADATGVTIDWTLEGPFLLLAPAFGTVGPVRAVDPRTQSIVPGRGPMDIIATVAAVGASSTGPLDDPRRYGSRPIDSGGPTPLGSPGLSLLGADDEQVDVLDLATNRIRTWPVGGVVPNPAGPSSAARVTDGWLVVRGGVVDLVTDTGGVESPHGVDAGFVDTGSLVFSSNHGRDAWIAIKTSGLQWRVEPYDPATGVVGPATIVGMPVGALDKGLLVTGTTAFGNTEFDFIDRAGRLQSGPVIDSTRINVLAAAGTHVAFLGSGGLFVLDVARGTNRLITDRAVSEVSLSADGTVLAWIEDDANDPIARQVMATHVDGTRIAKLGGPAERVLIADDGTVLFMSGADVRVGQVDADGSNPLYGLAPDPDAVLAIAYRVPVAAINPGPNFLP